MLMWLVHILGTKTVAQTKQLEVKVYLRQNQNNRVHAATACIGLWCHGAMQCSICMHKPVRCRQWPVTSEADTCTYCMDLKFQVCLRYTLHLLLWVQKQVLHWYQLYVLLGFDFVKLLLNIIFSKKSKNFTLKWPIQAWARLKFSPSLLHLT